LPDARANMAQRRDMAPLLLLGEHHTLSSAPNQIKTITPPLLRIPGFRRKEKGFLSGLFHNMTIWFRKEANAPGIGI
jgi:hypothetical protein